MNYNSIKTELSDDLISRQAVEEIINDIRDCISVEGYCAILERLKKLPSVNPQEPKTGHWKRNETIRLTYCSECGFGQHIDEFRTYNYCPNCGCRMVKPQKSEDEE